MERHVIEVLYSDRCRFVPLAIERVRAVLATKGAHLDIEIRLGRIETEDDAIRREFPGSPTVRVDGQDVDPRSARFFGLHGRAYLTGPALDEIERAPAVASIDAALEAATRRAAGIRPPRRRRVVSR